MNANVDTSGFSSIDKAKLWLAIAIAVVGVVAFYWFEGRQTIWARSGILLGAFAISGVLIALSAFGSFLKEFFVESHFYQKSGG